MRVPRATIWWLVRENIPVGDEGRWSWGVYVNVAPGTDALGVPYAGREDLVAVFYSQTDADEYAEAMQARQR